MGQQNSAARRASRRGIFYKARNVVVNNPTLIDGNHAGDNDSMKFLLSHTIIGAEYDSSEREPPPSCYPGTRLNISGNTIAWMRNPTRTHKTIWLHGPAGVGKSAVIQTLADSEADSENSILGATLFFSRPAERNDPKRVFNTIAYQLAVKYQPYRRYVVELLATDSRAVKKTLAEQFKRFIVKPFAEQRLLKGKTILITLDGLDECEGESAQCEIISLITKFSLQHPNTPLIWIIASRPEPHITSAFSHRDIQGSFLEIDMPIDSDQACADVELFLRDRFTEIREKYSTSFPPAQQWPTETQFVKVATRASGLFVFADTVVRVVEDPEYNNPVAQLQKVTDTLDNCLVLGAQENPFSALDALYTQILSGVSLKVLPVTRKLLMLLFPGRLWTFGVACNIFGISQADAYSALRKLYSVLKVPPPEWADSDGLRVFHTSFTDYLKSPARSGSFWVDSLEARRLWAASCIRVFLEMHNISESVVHVSSISISWPFDDIELVQRQVFSDAVEFVLHNLIGQPEYIGKFDTFFRDIDYANLCPSSLDEFVSLSVFLRPKNTRYFEGLGIFTTVPLQSLDLGSIDSNGVSFIASDERNSLPGQEDLKWNTNIYGVYFEEFFKSPQNRFKMFSELPLTRVTLSDEPGWAAHIHQHFTSMMDLLPSHPVKLLGKGQKTCAVIAFDNPDDQSWVYILPYKQS